MKLGPLLGVALCVVGCCFFYAVGSLHGAALGMRYSQCVRDISKQSAECRNIWPWYLR